MKLSIIIPAYNVQNNIHNTLFSLLNQSNKNFEIILVNDGSTDNTLEVVERILSKNNLINYKIVNKENGGVSSARNVGILEAQGEYLYFLDGDDYVSPNMVSIVNSYIINNNYPDIIAWGYDNVDENGNVLREYFDRFDKNKIKLQKMTGLEALENILLNKTFWIWTCSAVYKKELITYNNLFYSEGCSSGEDHEFIFKALSIAKEVIFVDKVLSFYVQREGSISNSYNIRRFDVVGALQRSANYIKINANDNILVDYLENNFLVDNFFYNFDSCLRYIYSSKKLTSIVNFSKASRFVNEIEIAYPGLTTKIKKKIIKSIKTAPLKVKIKCCCYLISPLLYIILTNIF
ncbi:MAG: glycosyltransferase [Firmicutes bacterium]|nr:glycosyltransferase [Bacillota bacterium]